MTEQIIQEKWIQTSASFKEAKDKEGNSHYMLEALIVPFDQVSRNGVRYNKESIEKTYKQLESKPLNHNHVTSGADVLPRGKWIETWIGEDGMYGRAEVFNTSYNKDYIEWLKADNSPRVSLQVTGKAKQFKEESTGRWIREAYINDWLETSTVNVPGFDSAKANFEIAIVECFGDSCKLEESKKDDFFEQLLKIRKEFDE